MKNSGFIKLAIVFFMLLPLMGFAQKKPTIQFESKIFDFGILPEEKGPTTGVFNFINIGTDTLYITAVRPSCGCTASNYTKDPILPGGKGVIEATYNPTGRPGQFNKAITVTTNDPDNPSIVLTIKGEVTPKPKSKADNYPNKLGNLMFKTNHLAFQDIKNTEIKTDTFKMYNGGKTPLNLKFNNLPEFLTAQILPAQIGPDQEGLIIIQYNGKLRNDYGYVFDKFFLTTDDTDQPEKLLYCSANIVQDFSWMTEKDLKKAPIVVFETESYDFGTVKEGTNVEYRFVFTNNGKSTLKILKTKASCGCTATNPTKTELRKGESSDIQVIFNTSGRKGSQHKTITVITNDPNKSTIVLHIQGTVE